MKASDYKTQFLQILKDAFPNGLPEGATAMAIQIGDGKYEIHFDPRDYEGFVKPTMPFVKNAKARKKSMTEMLTAEDVAYLKQLHISVEDVEEPTKQ